MSDVTPGPPAPAQTITRPTPTSERSIVWIVRYAFAMTLILALILAFGRVPSAVILWLGLGFVLLVILPLLIALAYASPWLGTEKVEVGHDGFKIEVNSDKQA